MADINTNLKPIVWSIAGSDCSGGAGIQADLHTIHALGGNACSIITLITAQNPQAVTAMQIVDSQLIKQQIEVLQDSLPPQAIKLGALGNAATIATIIPYLKNYSGWKIADPVLKSSSQAALLEASALQLFITKLLPLVDLLTPNVPEASLLTGMTINNYADMEIAAKKLISLGCKNVLIKGGHLYTQVAADYWTDGNQQAWLVSPRYHIPYNHGSGCTLSAALATTLALGYSLKDALVIAKMYLNQGHALLAAQPNNLGAILHAGWPAQAQYLPRWCEHYSEFENNYAIPRLVEPNIGIYPIVDNAQWLARLVDTGVTTVQLRIKDKTGAELEQQIAESIKLAVAAKIKLYINDYWQLAIKYHAFGVHLGQQDLTIEAVTALGAAGLRLGISTHCYWELARAHQFKPSYIAIGPVFPTNSKPMPFAPHGLDGLAHWRKLINYPLVAIGGINRSNIKKVAACGVDGIAMISAITNAQDPQATIYELHSLSS